MAGRSQRSSKPKVLIVGGGVAGLEGMLALRDLAGDIAEVELLAPRRNFSYRPMAVGEPFGAGRVIDFDLEDLAIRAGGSFRLGSAIALDADRCCVVIRDGSEIPYDYLLLAPGTRMLWAVPGAITFWGVADEGGVAEVMRGLREGELRRVVFTRPGGASWPLPAYELALLAEAELTKAGKRDGATLAILTPEDRPLGMFGLRASEQLVELLGDRGIEVTCRAHPVKFDGGHLQIAPGGSIEADAVISSPRIEGRRIAGVPHDRSGFIPVDDQGRVPGAERVFAAGDVTSFPVKQGGIAAQQADAVAETIAAELGAELEPCPFDPVLRAALWTGERPVYLYGQLTGGHGDTSTLSEHAAWEHEGKIVGRRLAPFLDSIPDAEKPEAQSGQTPAIQQSPT